MSEKVFCCFCKHHIMGDEKETDSKKRLLNILKPYSCECKCDLQRKEHLYFATWGNDCCIISPIECSYFEN